MASSHAGGGGRASLRQFGNPCLVTQCSPILALPGSEKYPASMTGILRK